jgi:hypothetical protein
LLIQAAEITGLRSSAAGRTSTVTGVGSFPGASWEAADRQTDRLLNRYGGGKDLWLRSEAGDDRERLLFDRIAEAAGIRNGQITRQQLHDYLQEHGLPPGSGGPGFDAMTAGGPGFGAMAAGPGFPAAGFGAARAPLLDRLDRIEEQLRRIEKHLGVKENTAPGKDAKK